MLVLPSQEFDMAMKHLQHLPCVDVLLLENWEFHPSILFIPFILTCRVGIMLLFGAERLQIIENFPCRPYYHLYWPMLRAHSTADTSAARWEPDTCRSKLYSLLYQDHECAAAIFCYYCADPHQLVATCSSQSRTGLKRAVRHQHVTSVEHQTTGSSLFIIKRAGAPDA